MLTWEKDLTQDFTIGQWHMAANWTVRTSRNILHYETYIKLLHPYLFTTPKHLLEMMHLYGYPVTLLVDFPSLETDIPTSVGRLRSLVAYRSCSSAFPILDYTFGLDSWLFVTQVFIAARAAITSHWKQARPPVFSEVLSCLNEQVTFERMFAIQQGPWSKLQKDWQCWLDCPRSNIPRLFYTS